MNKRSIEEGRDQIIAHFGEWTAHNFQLVGDVYTIGERITGDEFRLRRVMQIIGDFSKRPLSQLRIVDLACLEGMYSVELARHGATVVAIEGRSANLEKVRFAKDALGLQTLEVIQDDVRNLTAAKYGHFDVVLCLGILYHLDAPDTFTFLEQLADVCTGFAIIATHTSLAAVECRTYKGSNYWGSSYQEHSPESSPQERQKARWASLDNLRSFVLTPASLFNGLARAGFTSAFQCRIPPETIYEYPVPKVGLDWATFVAIKGVRVTLESTPLLNNRAWEDLPDTPSSGWAWSWRSKSRAFLARLRRRMKALGVVTPH